MTTITRSKTKSKGRSKTTGKGKAKNLLNRAGWLASNAARTRLNEMVIELKPGARLTGGIRF